VDACGFRAVVHHFHALVRCNISTRPQQLAASHSADILSVGGRGADGGVGGY
jgi:hypothetical protein